MKQSISAPFFEIGIKNYIYGDEVLVAAKAADQAAIDFDVEVLMITPLIELRRLAENTDKLILVAPYMDTLRPGRGVADILPEAVRSAGAQGILINHCERPMTLAAISATIARAEEMEFFTFICADSLAETRAIAQLHPDILNPEPTRLIGERDRRNPQLAREYISAVKDIYKDILVEHAAGISAPEDVYDLIYAGADGVGVSSGIFTSGNPVEMIRNMIRRVSEARADMGRSI